MTLVESNNNDNSIDALVHRSENGHETPNVEAATKRKGRKSTRKFDKKRREEMIQSP